MKRVLFGFLILISTITTANAWWVPGHWGQGGNWIGGHYRYDGWVSPHVNYWEGMPYWEPAHPLGWQPYHPYFCPRCGY